MAVPGVAMRAGRLDRRLRIERLVPGAPTASGQIDNSASLLCEVWAEKLEETGREVWLARQLVAQITAGWRLRWSSTVADVTPGQEYQLVDEAGRIYDILRVSEEDRREGLLVFGTARAE